MIDPHKPKYWRLYWDMARAAARNSEAKRLQVGAIVVTPTGMISVGWNGMPAGFDNACETINYGWEYSRFHPVMETRPEVIHAERNAIDKMTRQGVSTQGSILFVTHAPCFECSKSIMGLGLKQIHYLEAYRCDRGIALLNQAGIEIHQSPV